MIKRKSIIEWIIALVLALVLAVILFGYGYGVAKVNSDSMLPQLSDKQLMIYQKWGLRAQLSLNTFRYKFPEKVQPKGRFKKTLNRNDIVLFDTPGNSKQIKRLVGLPGDTLRLHRRNLYINHKLMEATYPLQHQYRVSFKSILCQQKLEERLNLEAGMPIRNNMFAYHLSTNKYRQLQSDSCIVLIQPLFNLKAKKNNGIWPEREGINWVRDNFGPLYLPKQGDTLKLNEENLKLYGRLISEHEGITIEQIDRFNYSINGKSTQHYVFKNSYVFVLGDNRHESLDSRYYGPIPISQIFGLKKLTIFNKFAAED